MIKKCTCQNQGQDDLHGRGQRVFNEVKYPNGSAEIRCTVCGKVEKLTSEKGK